MEFDGESSRHYDSGVFYEGHIIRIFTRAGALVVRIYLNGATAPLEEMIFTETPHNRIDAMEKAMNLVETLARQRNAGP